MFFNSFLMVSSKVQNDPGVIVGPVSQFLGYILNFIFEFAYFITVENSLGLSLILFTIVVRALMIPLAVKQQKSMFGMQKLSPEIEKIKKKYPTSSDPEVQKKMNAEIQAMYAKSGVNPLSGCLPLVFQFPIFIALTFIMQQSFLFISKLNDIYAQLATVIQEIPDYLNKLGTLASDKIPVGQNYDMGSMRNFGKVLNKFSTADWETFLSRVPQETVDKLTPILEHKNSIEHFFTINLLEMPTISFPAILIPILAALATFLSSWVSTKQMTSTDKNAKMQQRIMLIVMPIMMGYFTFTLPAGVGLYWISSSTFQVCQQVLLHKYYTAKNLKPTTDKTEIVDPKKSEPKKLDLKKPNPKKSK